MASAGGSSGVKRRSDQAFFGSWLSAEKISAASIRAITPGSFLIVVILADQ
jgi:hypothetical protein